MSADTYKLPVLVTVRDPNGILLDVASWTVSALSPEQFRGRQSYANETSDSTNSAFGAALVRVLCGGTNETFLICGSWN